MRRIAIILLVLQLIGCCTLTKEFGVLREYVATALHGELVKDNGWVLHTPPKGWMSRWTMELLPEYFNGRFPLTPFDVPNYFGVVYPSDTTRELDVAIGVCFSSSLYPYKDTRGGGNCIDTWTGDSRTLRASSKVQILNISINNVDMEFDNTTVYFVLHSNILRGQEISSQYLFNSVALTPSLYSLSINNAPETKSFATNLSNSHIQFESYSTFFFVFEDMSYMDLENAVFVIDGLYHQGKQLPPLKVRLNYLDFSQVPEYVGNQARPE